MRNLFLVLCVYTALAAPIRVHESAFHPGSLAISGASNIAEHGGWERNVPGIEAGAWYRATAYYRSEAVEQESLQVVARLDWRDARNRRTGQPDYIYKARRDGAWTKVTLDAPAPPK